MRGAVVHVGVVFARPGEGFAFGALDAVQGHAVVFQHFQMALRVIVADDTYEMHGFGEIRGSQCGVGGRSTQELLGLGLRSDDVVNGNGASDDNRKCGHGEKWC